MSLWKAYRREKNEKNWKRGAAAAMAGDIMAGDIMAGDIMAGDIMAFAGVGCGVGRGGCRWLVGWLWRLVLVVVAGT